MLVGIGTQVVCDCATSSEFGGMIPKQALSLETLYKDLWVTGNCSAIRASLAKSSSMNVNKSLNVDD